MIRVHDISIDEIIDREMTDAEFEIWEKNQANEALRQAEAEAKSQAKSELLQKLGISEEEAKLLLS